MCRPSTVDPFSVFCPDTRREGQFRCNSWMCFCSIRYPRTSQSLFRVSTSSLAVYLSSRHPLFSKNNVLQFDNLKCVSGAKKVRTAWVAFENNACVEEYIFDVKEMRHTARHLFEQWDPYVKTDNKDFNRRSKDSRMESSVNEFSVCAASRVCAKAEFDFWPTICCQRFDNRYATPTVRSSPKNVCVCLQLAMPVKNLKEIPGDQCVEQCWAGPENDACVSEYLMRTRMKTDDYRCQPL